MIYTFVLAHATGFMAFAMIVTALASIAGLVLLILATIGLRTALEELKRARMEIRGHAPMHVATRKSFDERRKEEYAKRGIPWEESGKK